MAEQRNKRVGRPKKAEVEAECPKRNSSMPPDGEKSLVFLVWR